jgi:glutamine synthetase
MVRSLAERAGLRATFMPKPFASLTGSGCHAHLSLHDVATGTNVCGGGAADVHGLSPTALSFVGGLLEHAPALTALTNPTVNSYKRLGARTTASGSTWSPTAATWAGNNRTALIRVPGGAPRFELRLADMSANPYLMAAAIGAAGLDGVTSGATPPPPADVNMYSPHTPEVAAVLRESRSLPPTLGAALDALDASAALHVGLGAEFVASYVKLRQAHWEEYLSYLSPWELAAYLDC